MGSRFIEGDGKHGHFFKVIPVHMVLIPVVVAPGMEFWCRACIQKKAQYIHIKKREKKYHTHLLTFSFIGRRHHD